MLRALAVVVAVACSSSAGAQAPARDTPVNATGTAHIRGRVTDAAGRPLGYVEIRAGNGTPNTANGLTDRDGRFDLANLPAGTYTVSAVKPTYVRSAWGEERPEGPGRRFTLADGETRSDINFRLARGGVIAGKIVDEYGDPIVDLLVAPMRYQFVQGTRRLMPSGQPSQTNDIGEYRLYGLTPGQYYVSATLRTFTPIGTTTNERVAYAPTFYPGATSAADAQRLTIAPGQTMASINFALLPVQTAKVSGTVSDTDGKPIVGGIVMVTPKSTEAGVVPMPTQVRADGQFTVSALAPGEYTLRANDPMARETGTADVTVTGSDISGVQLVTVKPSSLRGRVVFTPNATGADPPKPTAVDLGAVRGWALGQPVRSQAQIKDDGTFEISLEAGRVQLRAAPTGGGSTPWRLNRVIYDGVDVGDRGLDVPATATIENLVVEMTNRSTELSGRVTGADGGDVRDCWVIVFAQDPERWTVQTRYLGITQPRNDDRYRMRLLPGEYYAVAMSGVQAGAWTDRDFLSLAREHAAKISIAAGGPQTLDLPLAPTPVF